jgi:hypothetical protein
MEQQILMGLMARGIPEHVARGIVANMMVESRLDPGINEISPMVEGSRGGYGLNQWTGPRRRQYEAFAAQRGASLDDLNTQLDFTLWELQNSEKAAGAALMGAPDAETAARLYSERFLRPGIPNMSARLNALGSIGPAGGPVPQQPPPNAFVAQQPRPQNALASLPAVQLDPQSFMTSRRYNSLGNA